MKKAVSKAVSRVTLSVTGTKSEIKYPKPCTGMQFHISGSSENFFFFFVQWDTHHHQKYWNLCISVRKDTPSLSFPTGFLLPIYEISSQILYGSHSQSVVHVPLREK